MTLKKDLTAGRSMNFAVFVATSNVLSALPSTCVKERFFFCSSSAAFCSTAALSSGLASTAATGLWMVKISRATRVWRRLIFKPRRAPCHSRAKPVRSPDRPGQPGVCSCVLPLAQTDKFVRTPQPLHGKPRSTPHRHSKQERRQPSADLESSASLRAQASASFQ